MKPILVSGADGQWFDQDNATAYPGKMQYKENVLFLTKNGNFIMKHRAGDHVAQTTSQALEFLRFNQIEIDEKLSSVLYPAKKEV